MYAAVAGRFRLLLRPLAAPGRSATSSARWCSTSRAGLGSFGTGHEATAERPAALAAAMPASWSGRHPVVGCTGFGGGGHGRFFSLFLPTDGCVCQVLDADLAAAGQVAPVGVRRRALLLLTGSWPVGMVRTMCSASPCWEAISDPICVLTLLLCRLQTCCRCTDGRGSREHEWDGFDERGGVILGVAGVRRQRLRFGERCPAGARARCGCWWRVGCAASCVPAGSR